MVKPSFPVASEGRSPASLEAEFTRAVTTPGVSPLVGREWEALFPRFARYYERLTRLPRRTRRALQRQWKQSLAALALLLALGQAPALAANFDIPCTDGVGDNAALIQAINDANNVANPGPDSITLDANCTHTLTAADNSTYGYNGLPVISSAITIEGHGSTIKRDPADPDQFRIFAVNSGGNLTLNETTLSGGAAGAFPGAFPYTRARAAASPTTGVPSPSRTAPSRPIARGTLAAACSTSLAPPR